MQSEIKKRGKRCFANDYRPQGWEGSLKMYFVTVTNDLRKNLISKVIQLPQYESNVI